MLKLFLLIAFPAILLADNSWGEDCKGNVSYIADKVYDSFECRFATGYHDMQYRRSLFVYHHDNPNYPKTWHLIDLADGRNAYNEGLGCRYTTHEDLKVKDTTLAEGKRGVPTNFLGTEEAQVYKIVQGNVFIAGILDLNACVDLLTRFEIKGILRTTFVREGIRTEGVDQEIREAIDPILDEIDENCEKIPTSE